MPDPEYRTGLEWQDPMLRRGADRNWSVLGRLMGVLCGDVRLASMVRELDGRMK